MSIGIGAVVLAAVIFGQLAQAGRHAPGTLAITDASMVGSMGTARASADSIQSVRCQIMGSEDPLNPDGGGILTASCTITMPDPANPDSGLAISKMCTTGNKARIEAIQAAGDSRIQAIFDPLAGTCKSILVVNSSEYAPKTP